MGFILQVDGVDTIKLGFDNIEEVEFKTDTPYDSNARSTDLGTSLIIRGKILTPVDGDEADSTIKLAEWSLVPAEREDCYRNLTISVIAASQIVREINLTNAFVVDYTEDYGHTDGVGTFYLYVKQKKDKMPLVKLEGGFGQE
jgi:hypothetical protein